MSGSRQVGRVLRQVVLADESRTPGSIPPSLLVLDEATAVTAASLVEDSTSAAAPASLRAAGEASGESIEAAIERRAAELADARFREAGESAFAQAQKEGFKAGHEAGVARGVKDGLAAAQTEWTALAVRAQALIDSARAAAEREARVSAEFALHLTFAAMRKLFGEAFASQAGVDACIGQALTQTDTQTVVSIRVSPADAALLTGTASSSGLLGTLATNVAVKADDRVGPGGCMIETSRGMLDARIETQLESLLQVLRTAYETHAALVPQAEERS